MRAKQQPSAATAQVVTDGLLGSQRGLTVAGDRHLFAVLDMDMLLRMQAWHDAARMRARANEIAVERYEPARSRSL